MSTMNQTYFGDGLTEFVDPAEIVSDECIVAVSLGNLVEKLLTGRTSTRTLRPSPRSTSARHSVLRRRRLRQSPYERS